MFQNLLFMMSLAGSTVFLLYILTYPFAKRYFSLRWRYTILKIAAAFYLFPLSTYKYSILDEIRRLFPGLLDEYRHTSGIMEMKNIVIIGSGFVKFSSGVRRIMLVMFFAGIISLVIIQRRIIQYRKWKRVCGADSKKPSGWEQELFTKVKKETGIKRNVELVCSENCRSPMASGLLSSVLVFPISGDKLDADKYEYMFRHELIHIKHHDLLIKYIGLLVMAVHWYNPLVYVMFHEISVISEMYCDSIVMRGKGEDERRKYGNLILTLATQNEYAGMEKFFAGLANSRSKKVYKRRILEMKGHKKHKVVLSVIVMALITMAGGMTAFAYDFPYQITGSVDRDFGEEVYFVPDSAETEQVKLPSDYFFIDDSGNIYDLSDSGINNRTCCVHDYSMHGISYNHKKDRKGGCAVETHDSFQCSKCLSVKVGKLKNVLTYKCCPH